MRNVKRTNWFGAALLLGLLVIAQSSALAHLSLGDSHPADESCAFCVGLSVFAAGNVSSGHLLDAFIHRTAAVDHTDSPFFADRFSNRLARGPPIAS